MSVSEEIKQAIRTWVERCVPADFTSEELEFVFEKVYAEYELRVAELMERKS